MPGTGKPQLSDLCVEHSEPTWEGTLGVEEETKDAISSLYLRISTLEDRVNQLTQGPLQGKSSNGHAANLSAVEELVKKLLQDSASTREQELCVMRQQLREDNVAILNEVAAKAASASGPAPRSSRTSLRGSKKAHGNTVPADYSYTRGSSHEGSFQVAEVHQHTAAHQNSSLAALGEKVIDPTDPESRVSESSRPGMHPILTARTNVAGCKDSLYEFDDTVWDAVLFCGLGVMKQTDQALLVGLTLLNILIQGVFIGLVGLNMVENPFYPDRTIVEALQDWRVSYAHNPDFADKFTNSPLAQDVCAKSNFVMQGAQQAQLYKDLDEYLGKFAGIPSGECLCMLAVFLWLLTCFKETKRIYDVVIGVWTPTDPGKSIWRIPVSYVEVQDEAVMWIHGEATQKNYQVFFTACRATCVTVLVLIPRLMVLLLLFIVGIFFLVATYEMDELILNAVALEVVLNVDEFLSSIFLPVSAARMVLKTQPLRVPRPPVWMCMLAPWAKLVVAGTVMTCVGALYLIPMVSTMEDVANAMCGGDTAFLAVELQHGAVVAGAPSKSGILRTSYAYEAVYQRTELDGAASTPIYFQNEPFVFNKVSTIQAWKGLSISQTAGLPPFDPLFVGCGNMHYVWSNAKRAPAAAAALRATTSIANTSCANLAPLCHNDSSIKGQVVRLFCPESCGAYNPLSGLFMTHPEDGLPATCLEIFATGLSQVPCRDLSLPELLQMRGWHDYLSGLLTFFQPAMWIVSQGNTTHYENMVQNIVNGMMTKGCPFFAQKVPIFGLDGTDFSASICDPDDHTMAGRRSIRPFCPVTCGCSTIVKTRFSSYSMPWDIRVGMQTHCPAQCF